jgi:hypothetical protein
VERAPDNRSTTPQREPKEIWKVPGSRHTGGVDPAPAEYERRVAGFFDDALLG